MVGVTFSSLSPFQSPAVAQEYGALKARLASAFPNDRVAYTRGKTEFVADVTERAKKHYGRS